MAGRIVTRRGQGSISFCDLSDQDGAVQIVAQADVTDEFDLYQDTNRLGTVIAVRGYVGTTRSGQLSVFVHDWALLARFCGGDSETFPKQPITDQEVKYRNRPLYLISILPKAAPYLKSAKRHYATQEV